MTSMLVAYFLGIGVMEFARGERDGMYISSLDTPRALWSFSFNLYHICGESTFDSSYDYFWQVGKLKRFLDRKGQIHDL